MAKTTKKLMFKEDIGVASQVPMHLTRFERTHMMMPQVLAPYIRCMMMILRLVIFIIKYLVVTLCELVCPEYICQNLNLIARI